MDNPLLQDTHTSNEVWKLLQQIYSQIKSVAGDTEVSSGNLFLDTQRLDDALKENIQLKIRIKEIEAENRDLRAENEILKAAQTPSERRSLFQGATDRVTATGETSPAIEQADENDKVDELLPKRRDSLKKQIDTNDDTVVSTDDIYKSQRSPEIGPLGLDKFAVSEEQIEPLNNMNKLERDISSSQLSVQTSSSPTITSSSPIRHRGMKLNELDFGDAYISKVISGECRISQLPDHDSYISGNESQILIPDSQNENESEETSTLVSQNFKKEPLKEVELNKRVRPPDECGLIMKGHLDFTKNPITNSPWWPEDFKVNPSVNFGKTSPFKMRKLDPALIHPALRIQYRFQRKHIQNEALKAFNKLAGPVEDDEGNSVTKDENNKPLLKTPRQALEDPQIDPVFKFELNRTNYMHNRAALGSINSNKIKLWLDMTDSPPGEGRSSFPNTQELKEDRKKAVSRARLIGLQRLFQAIYMVEPIHQAGNNLTENKENKTGEKNYRLGKRQVKYAQVGKFLFRVDSLNRAVQEDNFTIDKHIFDDPRSIQ